MAEETKGGARRGRRERDAPVRGSQVLPYDFTGLARDGGPCALARDLGDGDWSLRVFTADAPSRGEYVLVMTGDACFTRFVLSSDAVRVAEDDGASWRAFATVDTDECASWRSGPPPGPVDLPRSRGGGGASVAPKRASVVPQRIEGSRLHRREMLPGQVAWVALMFALAGLLMPVAAPFARGLGRRARRLLDDDASARTVAAARWAVYVGRAVTVLVGVLALGWVLASLVVVVA